MWKADSRRTVSEKKKNLRHGRMRYAVLYLFFIYDLSWSLLKCGQCSPAISGYVFLSSVRHPTVGVGVPGDQTTANAETSAPPQA